jgi:hypothetical protein
MRPETSGFTGFTRRSARDEAPACFVLFPAEWSTPGTEDAVRRPVGVANSPIRDAPFGIEKPHDLGRRDSIVVSASADGSRPLRVPPSHQPPRLTLPRHRIPPRVS